jgi:hypothetical protein
MQLFLPHVHEYQLSDLLPLNILHENVLDHFYRTKCLSTFIIQLFLWKDQFQKLANFVFRYAIQADLLLDKTFLSDDKLDLVEISLVKRALHLTLDSHKH